MNADDYQPIAVQLAEEEVLTRGISFDEFNEEELDALTLTRPAKGAVIIDAWQDRLKASSLFNLDREYRDGTIADRSIIIICVVLFLALLTDIWSAIAYLISTSFLSLVARVAGFTPLLLIVLAVISAIVLIWKRKGSGWYLSTAYASLLLTINGYLFVKSSIYYLQKNISTTSDGLGEGFYDRISIFEPELPQTFIPALIVALLLLYLLFRMETLAEFGYSFKDILLACSFGIFMVGVFMIISFWFVSI